MEREQTCLQTVMFMLESLKKEKQTEKASFCMLMVKPIEVSLRTDFDMVKESGVDLEIQLPIVTKENFETMRRMDLEFLNGLLETFIKEIL